MIIRYITRYLVIVICLSHFKLSLTNLLSNFVSLLLESQKNESLNV